jgi:hypothetical protein
MFPFGVTIPATVPQGSEIPEGLMNNPVFYKPYTSLYPTRVYLEAGNMLPEGITGEYWNIQA